MHKVLAVVLAGGEGSRLRPLTRGRCKPAVAFHGKHRIIDFVLSNLANSGVSRILLFVQYEPHRLIDHVARCWPDGAAEGRPSISIVAPHDEARGFRGTADAVYQHIERIEAERPDVVAVFSADHVYRMDVRQMIAFHRASGADVTVSTLPVALGQSHRFGIAETDANRRITGFAEKPQAALPLPGSRTHALASMGNYIFATDVLLRQLHRVHASGGTDFGRDVLPAMVKTHRVMAYDFATNVVPGLEASEEGGYWRDVGTIDAWFDAQFDAVGLRPKFQLTNPLWPIHTAADPAAPAFVEGGAVRRSVLACGSVVEHAALDGAILRGRVHVHPAARLEHCIVLDGARIGRGAQVRGAIIGEANDVPSEEHIGIDRAQDRRRFEVTSNGVVVVPDGYFPRRSDVDGASIRPDRPAAPVGTAMDAAPQAPAVTEEDRSFARL